MTDQTQTTSADATTSSAPQLSIGWRTDDGFSWSLAPTDAMDRHSHVIKAADGRLWIIDPIEVDGIFEAIEELDAPVAGVVVLLNRHLRDSGAFAKRFGVHVHVPLGVSRTGVPAGTLEYDTHLPGDPCRIITVRDNGRLWAERAMWWPETGILVIAEALGSVDGFTEGTSAPLAVHPILRMVPPRAAFAQAKPRTILLGHGPAITKDARAAIQRALNESRTRTPFFLASTVKHLMGSKLHGSDD